MGRVFYVHWNRQEALDHVHALRAWGHTVRLHCDSDQTATPNPLPQVCVISLARLPSHGRAMAAWLHEARCRRDVPIVFVDGAADKIRDTRARFPIPFTLDDGSMQNAITYLSLIGNEADIDGDLRNARFLLNGLGSATPVCRPMDFNRNSHVTPANWPALSMLLTGPKP